MQTPQPLARVVNLTDPAKNILFNMDLATAQNLLRTGTAEDIRRIDGQFALLSVKGETVRLARSIGRPLRYFIAKLKDGPCLVVADRIDTIHNHLKKEGLDDQFHPSYTRMVPAHYITEIALVGCPDPNPTYTRFFTPERNAFSTDLQELGTRYVQALYDQIVKWLTHRATDGPIGVCFSGGVDSGAVFLLTYHALLQLGQSPARLKAFTLSVEGVAEDLKQSRSFMESLGLSLFLEPIEVPAEALDWQAAIQTMEDYKPLDIQAATMGLALLRGIRERYPDWRWLIDGDGGDENLKDYPIEENPELTIRSVLNNLMLYHEGWGVEAIKHSLTYSGGLSRGYARTYAPASLLGFDGFSPYTAPDVIEAAEGIPFIALTDWDHDKLYALKGALVAAGIEAVTGMTLPVFPKRRFQHGATSEAVFAHVFPEHPHTYRRAFLAHYGA